MNLSDKLLKMHEGPIKVIVKDRKGKTITKQDGKDFMKMLDKEGIKNKIGNNRFLDDYVKEFNKTFDDREAVIVLGEGKKDYEIYHPTYTSAVQEAEDFAIKNGYEVDKEQMATDIGMGTQRPKPGKTTRFQIVLFKKGIKQKKQLHAQVYGLDSAYSNNHYELNMYIS